MLGLILNKLNKIKLSLKLNQTMCSNLNQNIFFKILIVI